MQRVLIVDDEPGMRAALEAHFLRRHWTVDTAANAAQAIEKFRRGLHPLVVTDIRMPGADGFTVMRDVRLLAPRTAIILLTAFGSVPDAVIAMKGGACDYFVKPVAFEQLERAAERVLLQARAQAEASEALVGHAPAWLRALDRARQAAASGADVLIEAESGTGKELVARLIHRLSARRDQAFVAINCSAFPETLLESELFGYARGAFTGALAAKPGRFELANRGTLLLDEIGEMPLALQPKLLRVLQEREFDRLGGTRSVPVDVRVIATTNRGLSQMVRAGTFRADLYYRLNVIPLTLPALRERREDIRELAEHFLRLYALPNKDIDFSADFISEIENHLWPGNVRELSNCVQRAIALATGSEIGAENLELAPPSTASGQAFSSRTSIADQSAATGELQAGNFSSARPHNAAGNSESSMRASSNPHMSLNDTINPPTILRPGLSRVDAERRLFELTLEATGGNRSRAAELLGVSLRTVRNKIRSYGLPSWSSYVHH